jgi:cardiolipin synthase
MRHFTIPGRRVITAHPRRPFVSGDGDGAAITLTIGHMAKPSRRRYPWWLIVLSILGFLAVSTALLTLFSPLGRRPPSAHIEHPPAVTDPQFLASIAGTAGAAVRAGGTVQLLNNGVAFFPALLQDLRAAQHTIHFVVYIWEPGQASDQVFAALTDRARAGVKVRLLLDGLGGMKAPEESVKALKAAGGQVEVFRAARFGKLTRFHKRIHRRSIVIDGTVGYTGGIAVADKWLGNADTEEHWRDTMVRVTGPLAATLQTAFVGPWTQSTGEVLAGDDVFPSGVVAKDAPAAIAAGETARASNPTASPSPAAAGSPPTQAVTVHTGLASSPSSEDHPMGLWFIQTFVSARRKLYITTPYFVPDAATREVVAQRARAGVDVKILLPDEHTDAKPIRLTSHRYYEELMEAGVHVYEYQPTMMHTKGVVVDGIWSVVGSANMDIRSEELNNENVLGILDEGFGRQMEETFFADLKVAQEIKLDEWRRRGWFTKAKERVAVLFAEQY